MKLTYALSSFALLAMAGTVHADLIISEVVDATLPGGRPKFVELTNTGAATIDLTQYSFGNFSNGGTSLGGGSASVLTGLLPAGESYVIAYEEVPVSQGGPGVSADGAAPSIVSVWLGGASGGGRGGSTKLDHSTRRRKESAKASRRFRSTATPQGTGSKPLAPRGWQRDSLRPARRAPRTAP